MVLFDQIDNETFAYVQMFPHKMEINISGENRDFLKDFIMKYIQRLVYNNSEMYLKPKVMQRIIKDGTILMIDIDFSNNRENKSIVDLKNKEKIVMANTYYNISGGVHGSNLGEHGTVNNYNQVINNLEQLREAFKQIDDDGARELVIEAEVLIAEPSDSPTLGAKLVKFKEKAVGFAKDIGTVGKARDAIEGSGLMDILNSLSF